MKRILFVNEIGEIAGTETMTALIMAHLDRSRYWPVIACPDGPIVERIKQNGIEHIPFTFRMRRLRTGSSENGGIRVINPLSLAQKIFEGSSIARFIRQYKIDVIHTNSLSSHIAGLVAAKLTGKPVIWHIHTLLMSRLYKSFLPDRIVFVSDFVMKAAFPRKIPPIARRIYNGIDLAAYNPDGSFQTDLRQEYGIRFDQPIVILIGHLDPIKGQQEVLTAWPQVTAVYPEARLVFVGKAITPRGEVYAERLKMSLQELGITDTVIFAGYRSDIAAILHSVNIVVSFTLNEMMPLVVIEAMSMGKAIIGANSGGLPELIRPGISGMLVNNGDINGLASAINTFLGDTALRQRMGNAARQRALAEFNIETCVSQIQSLYEEILG